jgi:hypothetical protein
VSVGISAEDLNSLGASQCGREILIGRFYLSPMMEVLNVKSNAGLIQYAVRQNLIAA